ncbi:hypothetical protein MKZ38_008676 [Zalerion maritima]|uniref:Uncharacterized protein n=1 Tax=Zalerion maritima TaxID=339359 RepID=A0AAD5WNH8_9PEZI|nr:hypothetical protein MKZ38_008676 [Zalerion maritima]
MRKRHDDCVKVPPSKDDMRLVKQTFRGPRWRFDTFQGWLEHKLLGQVVLKALLGADQGDKSKANGILMAVQKANDEFDPHSVSREEKKVRECVYSAYDNIGDGDFHNEREYEAYVKGVNGVAQAILSGSPSEKREAIEVLEMENPGHYASVMALQSSTGSAWRSPKKQRSWVDEGYGSSPGKSLTAPSYPPSYSSRSRVSSGREAEMPCSVKAGISSYSYIIMGCLFLLAVDFVLTEVGVMEKYKAIVADVFRGPDGLKFQTYSGTIAIDTPSRFWESEQSCISIEATPEADDYMESNTAEFLRLHEQFPEWLLQTVHIGRALEVVGDDLKKIRHHVSRRNASLVQHKPSDTWPMLEMQLYNVRADVKTLYTSASHLRVAANRTADPAESIAAARMNSLCLDPTLEPRDDLNCGCHDLPARTTVCQRGPYDPLPKAKRYVDNQKDKEELKRRNRGETRGKKDGKGERMIFSYCMDWAWGWGQYLAQGSVDEKNHVWGPHYSLVVRAERIENMKMGVAFASYSANTLKRLVEFHDIFQAHVDAVSRSMAKFSEDAEALLAWLLLKEEEGAPWDDGNKCGKCVGGALEEEAKNEVENASDLSRKLEPMQRLEFGREFERGKYRLSCKDVCNVLIVQERLKTLTKWAGDLGDSVQGGYMKHTRNLIDCASRGFGRWRWEREPVALLQSLEGVGIAATGLAPVRFEILQIRAFNAYLEMVGKRVDEIADAFTLAYRDFVYYASVWEDEGWMPSTHEL